MITTGGEVAFVRRMVEQSLNETRVLWWTCMLGKLSSVQLLSGDLKQLSKEGKVAGWGVSVLETGGGRTRRWVLIWSSQSAMRIPDVSLSKVLAARDLGGGTHADEIIFLTLAWTYRG